MIKLFLFEFHASHTAKTLESNDIGLVMASRIGENIPDTTSDVGECTRGCGESSVIDVFERKEGI